MTAAEIISELDDHGFADTSSTRKVAMLNDTYFEVLSLEAWPFLEASTTVTTTAGTAALTMPSDFNKALALVDEDNDYVIMPERMDTVVKNEDATLQGDPLVYYFVGETVNLWPVPPDARTLKLYYIKEPIALTSGSSESAILLPARHHRLLVLGALVKLYSMEDDPELAQIFDMQFERKLERMRNDLWMRQFDRPDRIHVLDDDLFD